MPSPAAFKSLRVFDVDYAYLDSGPPASANYTTWVFLHGMGFNGAVFEKLPPLAHSHNLRIGTEIATFLVNFVTAQDIPPVDPDSLAGGIALIGWSLAGIHVLAVLAFFDELPEDTQLVLRNYLHTILSHDATGTTLGIPKPTVQGTTLWSETDDRKRLDAFFEWVAAHYIHKSVTSENLDDLEFSNPSEEDPRSLHELSYAQRAEYTCLEAFSYAGCDGKVLLCHITAFAALTKRALFDKARAEEFPAVRVRYMSGGTTLGMLVWALWTFRKYAVHPPEALYGSDAARVKDIKFIAPTEGNHFVFWDDPEKAIQQYRAAINL